ncbi:MAG: hypothetical protein RML36_13140 [Anaerolineae bacterium]|nr:hypothetical protein [Anaerolineae bacterium]MDW8100418.1 hypothetical protein [Anaerolineae bacterium]
MDLPNGQIGSSSKGRIQLGPWEASRRGHTIVWIALAYTLLTFFLTYPTIVYFLSAIPGDSFDGWQNLWNLWWIRRAILVEHRHPFFTDVLYHPTGVSLLFHTLNPFNGLFSLPVQLAAGLFAAYNSVVFFSFAVGGVGGYLLARSMLHHVPEPTRTWAAFLAGVVYTFSPFHFAHLLGHMQVFSLEWIPFYALYLWRGIDRAQYGRLTWRDIAFPALFLALMALCDWYFVLYSLLFTGLAWLYLLWRKRLTWRIVGWTAAVGGSFALMLSPLLGPMIVEASRYDFMVPPAEQAYLLSADLLAFLTPHQFHPLWGQAAARFARHFISSVSEHTTFVGYVPLLLGIWGIRCGNRLRGFWALAALSFALLAMGPVLHVAGRPLPILLPYALLQPLPIVRITRSVSRFDAMVMLAMGVLAAGGLVALIRRLSSLRGFSSDPELQSEMAGRVWESRPHLIALAVVTLTLFEFLPIPYPISHPDTPPWYERLAEEPGDFAILNLPMNWDRPGYLLYQTVHGKRLTAGYISREDPRTLVERAPGLQQLRHLGPDVINQDLEQIGRSVLTWLNVRYVVLDRYQMPGEREREGTIRYARAALAGLSPIYEDERLTVYRVEPPATPQPFLVLGIGWGTREVDGETPWRRITGETTLLIYTETPITARLYAVARGETERVSLKVRTPAGDAILYILNSQPREIKVGPLMLEPGLHVIRLSADSPAWLTGLNLVR